MVDYLEESDLSDRFIFYIWETSGDVDESEKAEKKKPVQDLTESLITESFFKCNLQRTLRRVYEGFSEEKDYLKRGREMKENYCIRKYVIDTNLINLKNISIEINPKNVDTTNIDFNMLIKNSLKTTGEDLVNALLEDYSRASVKAACLLEDVREGRFAKQLLQFEYLTQLDLDEEQEEELEGGFDDMSKALAESLVKCFV